MLYNDLNEDDEASPTESLYIKKEIQSQKVNRKLLNPYAYDTKLEWR